MAEKVAQKKEDDIISVLSDEPVKVQGISMIPLKNLKERPTFKMNLNAVSFTPKWVTLQKEAKEFIPRKPYEVRKAEYEEAWARIMAQTPEETWAKKSNTNVHATRPTYKCPFRLHVAARIVIMFTPQDGGTAL